MKTSSILVLSLLIAITLLGCPEPPPACAGEGETIPVIANPPQCCEGLELIPPKQANILGSAGICTAKCGNGTCDVATESAYNCPVDCEPKLSVAEHGFEIQFLDADETPIQDLELEFAPITDADEPEFDKAKKYVSNEQGKITLAPEDLEYLFLEYSDGEGHVKTRMIYQGETIANTVRLMDMQWLEPDEGFEQLEQLEILGVYCDFSDIDVLGGSVIQVTLDPLMRFMEVPESEVFEIEGMACPIPSDDPEKNFVLPDGCSLLANAPTYGFMSVNVGCINQEIEDMGCVYYDLDEVMLTGGKLVRTTLTDKTLIECRVEDYYAQTNDFIRGFDYHPGPYVLSFYIGYDPETKELTKISDWDSLFAFFAPIDSEEKVWGALSLATSSDIYCSFESEGLPPWPPEGYVYDEAEWFGEYEEFWVPKEEIKVSSIEETNTGYKMRVLAEEQGCPCYIDFYEYDLEVTYEGEVTKGEATGVYSANSGCIC
ncbi:MAG: hypothetical protein JW772_04010 [Candidatus Diapherotrites archaeon]|nr:hypothetical protein [Candidatus Diapherotrites archaeon]